MSAILIYRLLQVLAIPLIVVYFLLRGLRDRNYLRNFRERLGFLPDSYRQTGHAAIWLHAVSVGEVLSAITLVRQLREQFAGEPLFVSCATVAGKAAAESKLAGLVDGVFYAPLDYASVVRRVLRTLRPRLVVVLETEIWPNLYRETKRAGCGLVVINGRISDSAMPRYRRMRWFFQQVLAFPDRILAQDGVSFERYLQLGAPPDRTAAVGNLKYDFDPAGSEPPAAVRDLVQRLRPSEVWIAASTMAAAEPGDPDEDEAVIKAFHDVAAKHHGLLLMLVPRKPERFSSAAEALERSGVEFVRRSELGGRNATLPRLPAILLVDSMGELGSLFRMADVVFMGGTLAHRGGHNILEPAFFGKAVIAGPHLENFPEIERKFVGCGALVRVDQAAGLAAAVNRLIEEPAKRAEIGRRAREAAESERGATARALAEIEQWYSAALPRYRRTAPAVWALAPLSRLWLTGSRWKQAHTRCQRLTAPVISVGALTVGGTGKTPVVLWLARQLKERGFKPAVLTRGYRRKTSEPQTIVAPGENIGAERTGDEAQTYVRAGVGPIGIGADRARTGKAIEERFAPDVFLLDDGFQHWRLERSFDLVVLDGLDPFGGGEVMPLGRLRESLDALSRAGAVLVTRTRPGCGIRAIETEIRKYNASAPVFAVHTVPVGWVNAETGQKAGLTGTAAAFCGLGNPDSFWRSLRALRIDPVLRRAFPDHHAYNDGELSAWAAEAQAAGAEVLLTTEKDVANLPPGWQDLVRPLPVLWLEIDLKIDDPGGLLDSVAHCLATPREIS